MCRTCSRVMTLSARSMPAGWYWNGCRTRTTPVGARPRSRRCSPPPRASRSSPRPLTRNLVFDEDVETIRRFALGGQDLSPEAFTRVVSHLDRDWAWVEAMAPREVLFGDLHFGNAAFRSPPPDLAALLYDPIPRRQPWPFAPAYLEVLCDGAGLVREMAAIRRVQGRAVCEPDEVDRLSALFCGWLALELSVHASGLAC